MANRDKIRVFVVEDDRTFRESIRNLLELESWVELVGMAGDVDEAAHLAYQAAPDVILSDYFLPSGTGGQAAEKISAMLPGVPLIMMSVDTASDVMRHAILSGAKDFLPKPFGPTELYAALRRVSDRIPAPDQIIVEKAAPPEGAEIVALHSPKGGCGVTSMAINLAVAKRLETGARVALLDLSLTYGDVGLMMDLSAQTNIFELSMKLDELDQTLLADVMVTHPSGVKVLLAPAHPQQAESVTAAHVRQILAEMSIGFDYIFVDTAHDLSEVTLVALDQARTVLLVASQDVAAVRDVKLFMEVAALLGYPREKVRLVLNRVNTYTPLTPSAIEQRLELQVAGAVPEDLRLFAEASGRGIPVVLAGRGSLPAREIRKIASNIQAQQVIEDEKAPGSAPARVKRKSLFARARA